MTEEQIINQISRCFARLRAEAGLSQTNLAKKIGIDQAKLSRIENGEVYTPYDAEKYLEALGTPNATKFKDFMLSSWAYLEIPDFWNPQYDSLLYAEEIARRITDFLTNYQITSPLRNYLSKGKEQLIALSKYLCSENHNIAFLGSIGIGKSTAISYLFKLLVKGSDAETSERPKPILETGAGGTTICEVQIVDSDDYGINIIPYSDEEFNNIISDFCKIFWLKYYKNENHEKRDNIFQSKEIERALRNMSKLTVQRTNTDRGKSRFDPIEQLVTSSSSEDEFKVKILNRINLQSRSITSITFDKNPSKNPTAWLADKFKEINNGRVDDMPMPKIMFLQIPKFNTIFTISANHKYNISVIDTKGIDDIIVRSDIDSQIKNERTIIVFCTRFNDASGKPTKEMIDHIKNDLGISVENGKFALLILPHSGEALQVKDDLGNLAYDVQEGYEIKTDQINDAISDNIPIYFYNAFEDDSTTTIVQLKKQIGDFRENYADKINELALTMAYAMDNSEEVAYLQAIDQITKKLSFFLKGNSKLPPRIGDILSEVDRVFYSAHPSTLWASTRRRGIYGNLNICYVISNSATSDANKRFDKWLNIFQGEINTLKADESLVVAEKYINDIETFTKNMKSKFLEAVINCGTEVYCENITSANMWYDCSSEWGRGPGFKVRVLNHIKKWFNEHTNLQNELDELIESFWNELVITSISNMIERHSGTH